jgi:hypothetical protein
VRWAFGFFTLCLVLAIVRAALIALAIATVLALIYAFLTRPRETLVFLGVLTLSGLATAQPLAFIIALAVLGVAVVLADWKRTLSNQPRLTDQSEQQSPGGNRPDRDVLG